MFPATTRGTLTLGNHVYRWIESREADLWNIVEVGPEFVLGKHIHVAATDSGIRGFDVPPVSSVEQLPEFDMDDEWWVFDRTPPQVEDSEPFVRFLLGLSEENDREWQGKEAALADVRHRLRQQVERYEPSTVIISGGRLLLLSRDAAALAAFDERVATMLPSS